MKNLFYEVNSLDKRCYEEFFLSEDILMEHAALSLANEVKKLTCKKTKVLFICGSGNNGADGIAAARMLVSEVDVSILLPLGVKSEMAKLQLQRAQSLHVKITKELEVAEIYVDCLFGSGFKKEMSEEICNLLDTLNKREGRKIACDIPSGICIDGTIKKSAFKADTTITMGALKEALYSDKAKDFIGEIKVVNLGISRDNYEIKSDTVVLEESDMKLPFRDKKATHKGSYGHVCVVGGEKEGASTLSCIAAFNFGAGLVSMVCEDQRELPPYLMRNVSLPENTSVVVAGMGLGKCNIAKLYDLLLSHPKPLVIDADLFYEEIIVDIVKKESVVLTPHPKEFCSMLKILGIAEVSTHEVQEHRLLWVKAFSERFSHVTLLLKGANTIITQNQKIYINPLGTQKLAKGGSGDVLAGMIGSLLAQGYTTLDATVSASLAHALAAKKLKSADYALNPLDICEGIKWL